MKENAWDIMKDAFSTGTWKSFRGVSSIPIASESSVADIPMVRMFARMETMKTLTTTDIPVSIPSLVRVNIHQDQYTVSPFWKSALKRNTVM